MVKTENVDVLIVKVFIPIFAQCIKKSRVKLGIHPNIGAEKDVFQNKSHQNRNVPQNEENVLPQLYRDCDARIMRFLEVDIVIYTKLLRNTNHNFPIPDLRKMWCKIY